MNWPGFPPLFPDAAAWAQAIGSFLAIVVALWLSGASGRQARSDTREKRQHLQALGQGVTEEVQLGLARLLKVLEADPKGEWDVERAKLSGLAHSIRQITASNGPEGWRYWDVWTNLNGLAELLTTVMANPVNFDRASLSQTTEAKLDADLRAASAFCDTILASIEKAQNRGWR